MLEQAIVEADVAPLTIDRATRAREQVERPVPEDLHPDLAQDPERGEVDRLDLVCTDDLDRAVWVDDRPPGQLGQPAGCAPPASADAAGGHRRSLTHPR